MKKILVVDDQIVIVSIIQTLLESCGFDVVATTHSTSVCELIEQEQPEMLIIDIVMPEKDGIENIQEVRQAYPELVIVAISSHEVYLSFAEKLGADHTYTKPIIPGHFRDFITDIAEPCL